MTDKSVFADEPDSTKRRKSEDEPEFSNKGAGRHRGTALNAEEQQQEDRAKGHRNAGSVGVDGNVEISDPHTERGTQHGYGKNQDAEQERKTAQGKAQGAQEGRYRPEK
jgi:hypothetical protein